MTDREKVISEGQEAIEMLERVEEPTPWCDFIRNAFENAIALLKAQEPVEERLNLCDSCTKEYAECEADKDDLVYGNGVGNDNIIGCPWYVNRWKAQEPVEPIENAGFYYCGACKYAFTSAKQKYCSNCGQAVKWE